MFIGPSPATPPLFFLPGILTHRPYTYSWYLCIGFIVRIWSKNEIEPVYRWIIFVLSGFEINFGKFGHYF